MEAMKIRNLYNLEETIAAPLLEQYEYPWEVLPYIKEFIKALGNALPEDRFEKRGEDIWVAKSATVAPTACLNGPCIVDEEAEIRHCAFYAGFVGAPLSEAAQSSEKARLSVIPPS